jgi:hypothetical protein
VQIINNQTVDALKAAGHYFAAGAVAKALGRDSNYGCHFGMRSTCEAAKAEYKRGWEGK